MKIALRGERKKGVRAKVKAKQRKSAKVEAKEEEEEEEVAAGATSWLQPLRRDLRHLFKRGFMVALVFPLSPVQSQIMARTVREDQTSRSVLFIFHAAVLRKQRKEGVRGSKN